MVLIRPLRPLSFVTSDMDVWGPMQTRCDASQSLLMRAICCFHRCLRLIPHVFPGLFPGRTPFESLSCVRPLGPLCRQGLARLLFGCGVLYILSASSGSTWHI